VAPDPGRRIEGHHDFAVLEWRLAGLLREAGATGAAPASGTSSTSGVTPGPSPAPLPSVAIVAPTRRLIDHLRSILAGRFPALLGVHFFHHQSLARAAAAADGVTLPRIAREALLEAILARVLGEARGDLSDYARARPGALRSILASLLDLREAGVPAGAGRRGAGLSDRGRELLRLYASFTRAVEALRAAGIADRTAALEAARPHVAGFARRFRLVVHYGAYDLTGEALELMRAVESGAARVVHLTPYHPDSPAYAGARRFWPVAFGAPPALIEPPAEAGPTARLCATLLPHLYREDSRPARPARIDAFQAQGAGAELREVALRILGLHHREQVRLRDIAVIGRSLEPYAAHLEPVFAAHGLPFVTSASLPALREVRVQAALRLARIAAADFERQPLMDLARSGLLRIAGRPVGAEAHDWDYLSRLFQVTGGLEDWTQGLPRWVAGWRPYAAADDPQAQARAVDLQAARRREADDLAEVVRRIDRILKPARRASGWRIWADRFEAALEQLLDGFEPGAAGDGGAGTDRGAAAVLAVLDLLRDHETAGLPYTAAGAWSAFETALGDLALPIGAVGGSDAVADDNGGVRVLDTMQARGLAFRAVFLIGLNADLFPRRATEDPFLGDADRQAIREAHGVPLALSSAALEEEHLLLAHMIGGARDHLVVSWQRADEAGRVRVPSLALREIARIGIGEPLLEEFTRRTDRVPGHPGEAAVDARDRHAMLPAPEARVGAAIDCHDAARFAALLPGLPALGGGRAESLRAGLEMLGVLEDAGSADLRFDACPGPGSSRSGHDAWSPSRLEVFGQCPQRHFFARVLGIAEREELARPWEIDAAELGACVHEALREIGEAIRRAGDLEDPGRGSEAAIRSARGLVAGAWDRATRALRDQVEPRYPAWWEAQSAAWRSALERFLEEDLRQLGAERARFIAFEEPLEAALDLGGGRTLPIGGRIDRAVALPGPGSDAPPGADVRFRVGDYKTSKNLADFASITKALKGQALQIPIYMLLAETRRAAWGAAGSPVDAEVLGVGPRFTAAAIATPDPPESRAGITATRLAANRAGLLETLRVLDDLARSGSFPLNPDGPWCGWCPFRRACRRNHLPTLDRVRGGSRFADYYDLDRKSRKAPTLAEARSGATRVEER
jgi:ATP-dependent helicase/nuclease subunit B